jgi:hypothetical protein
MQKVIENVPPSLLLMTVRFGVTLKTGQFNRGDVIKMLRGRGFQSLDDLKIVVLLVDNSSVIPILSFLFLSAISKKWFMRACFSVARDILLVYGGRQDVRDWTAATIRRFFVFIWIAHSRRKCRIKSLLLCECISSLYASIPWLPQITSGSATAMGTRSVPHFFANFFTITSAIIDDDALHEFEHFLVTKMALKSFPFDVNKKAVGFVPVKETAIIKPPQSPRVAPGVRSARSERMVHEPGALSRGNNGRGMRTSGTQPMIRRLRKGLHNRSLSIPGDSRLPSITGLEVRWAVRCF